MEQSDLSELRTEGTIRDEKVMYELLSAGSACGNTSSIKIDGTEYSKNGRGLNIVVYNHETKISGFLSVLIQMSKVVQRFDERINNPKICCCNNWIIIGICW